LKRNNSFSHWRGPNNTAIMVSTRHHPRPFPEPRTPTPASAVRSTASSNTSRNSASPKPDVARRSQGRTSKSASASPAAFVSSPSPSSHSYSHVANPIITTWLLISLPLVFWDTGYIFLRPHSMPGGRCHWPLWTPYALYGTVDYMYGWPAWNNGVGFTAAQGTLNALEAALYIYYLYVLATQGGNAVLRIWDVNGFWRADVITVQGPAVTTAVLACFASAVMTVSKTVLYCK